MNLVEFSQPYMVLLIIIERTISHELLKLVTNGEYNDVWWMMLTSWLLSSLTVQFSGIVFLSSTLPLTLLRAVNHILPVASVKVFFGLCTSWYHLRWHSFLLFYWCYWYIFRNIPIPNPIILGTFGYFHGMPLFSLVEGFLRFRGGGLNEAIHGSRGKRQKLHVKRVDGDAFPLGYG